MPAGIFPFRPRAARSERLPVGYLSKAHGIRGELVLVLTADLEKVEGPVFLRHKNGGPERPFVLERARRHHGAFLVSFAGVTTRTEAEELRSHTVLLDRRRLPRQQRGEPLLEDLPGLAVLLVEESGAERELGRIASAEAPAGQVIWSILTPEGKEILFPAVPEFIRSLDLEKGEARIVPPPGLLDLYLG